MMEDPIFLTMVIGSGLLFCGYLIGRSSGWRAGADGIMNELIESKLVDPARVLNYYANQGDERARTALARLNAERKTKFMSKDNAED